MTTEELVRRLMNRLEEKRRRSGEFVLTAQTLLALLESSLPVAEQEHSGTSRLIDPGYPKRMTRARPSLTPWNPTIEVPETTYVGNRLEEEEAARQGFSLSAF